MTEGRLKPLKKQDTDELLTLHSDIRDKRIIQQINAHRKHGSWQPHKKGMQCQGCKHSDIHVISRERPNHWNWNSHIANELSVYCQLKAQIVRFPYEVCRDRLETPKITMDSYINCKQEMP